MDFMRRYSNYSPLFFCFAIRYHSNIRQSDDFSSVITQFSASSEKSAAIFDLDNTLIMGLGYKPRYPRMRISGYGSDHWFSAEEEKIKQRPIYSHERFMMLLAEYHAIQPYLQQTTTEDCVPEKLLELKKRNVPIFGLTARSFCLSETTNRVLNELGIEFTNNEDTNSIIFCDGESKSARLKNFLKTPFGHHSFFGVKRVLFMDDKLHHCKDVEGFFVKNNVESIVVHYTRVENKLPKASDEDIEKDRTQLMRDYRPMPLS